MVYFSVFKNIPILQLYFLHGLDFLKFHKTTFKYFNTDINLMTKFSFLDND